MPGSGRRCAGAARGGITLTNLPANTLQGDAVMLDILRQSGMNIIKT